MRNKITLEMSICQAENGFSLDELVKKLADAFKNKAFADILKMNLQLTQEVLMYRIFNNSSSQKCCPDGHLTLPQTAPGASCRRKRTNRDACLQGSVNLCDKALKRQKRLPHL